MGARGGVKGDGRVKQTWGGPVAQNKKQGSGANERGEIDGFRERARYSPLSRGDIEDLDFFHRMQRTPTFPQLADFYSNFVGSSDSTQQ